MRIIIFCFAMFFTANVMALTIEKINFPETAKMDSIDLTLNGAGLRTKKRFGINWKVYVAGLYVKQKTQDAKALIESGDPKMMKISFLRSVDKKTLQEGWTEGITNNCKYECEKLPNWLQMLGEILMDVNDKSAIQMNFEKDAVVIQVQAKDTRVGRILGEAFRKNLLAAFIGDKPPTEDFKKGLLGSSN